LGVGVQQKRKKISVQIPEGVDEGMLVRIRGEGEAIKSGTTGDLFIKIHVKSDHRFKRQGYDIFSEVSIGFTQAALGDSIEIETIDGVVELKIPPGTQSETSFRLRHKGVPGKHSSRGDQYVLIHVVTPKRLSRKEKELLEALNLREK